MAYDVLSALASAACLAGEEHVAEFVDALTEPVAKAALVEMVRRDILRRRQSPVGRWVTPSGPERVTEALSDDIGSIIRYSGQPPAFIEEDQE